MSISRKISLGLFVISGLMVSIASYLGDGLIGFLIIAGLFVLIASTVSFVVSLDEE